MASTALLAREPAYRTPYQSPKPVKAKVPAEVQPRASDTLTRAAIADAIHQNLGLSRSESLAMVESILTEMCEALARGENVKISGFGTFLLRDKGERVGRNPKTGVEVPITSRRVLTFRSSQMLKDRIVGKP